MGDNGSTDLDSRCSNIHILFLWVVPRSGSFLEASGISARLETCSDILFLDPFSSGQLLQATLHHVNLKV